MILHADVYVSCGYTTNMKKVMVIPIVVGVLGTIFKDLEKDWGKWRSKEELRSDHSTVKIS